MIWLFKFWLGQFLKNLPSLFFRKNLSKSKSGFRFQDVSQDVVVGAVVRPGALPRRPAALHRSLHSARASPGQDGQSRQPGTLNKTRLYNPNDINPDHAPNVPSEHETR